MQPRSCFRFFNDEVNLLWPLWNFIKRRKNPSLIKYHSFWTTCISTLYNIWHSFKYSSRDDYSLSPFLLLIKSLFLIRIAFVRSVDGITKIISGAGLFFCSLYYYFEHRYLSLASNGFLYVVLIFSVIFVYNPTLLKEFFRPVNQVSVEKGILVYDFHYDPSHNETAILWDFSSTMTS